MVFAAGIAEPGNFLAIGRPGGEAIGCAAGLGEVAPIAVFFGYRENLAPVLKQGALPGGRKRGIEQASSGYGLPTGAGVVEVGLDLNVQLFGFACLGIHQVQIATLLINQSVSTGVDAFYIKILVKRDLLQVFALGVKTPDIVGIIALGEEIDLPFVPYWIGVPLAVGLRRLDQGKILEVDNPDRLCLATPVIAPFWIPKSDGLIGGVLAIFGNFTKRGLRNGQHFFKAAFGRNAVKLVDPRRYARPSRAE